MAKVKKILLALIILVVLVFGTAFALSNSERVAIDLIFIQLPSAPVSIWMTAAFVLGAVCALLFASLGSIRQKTQIASLQYKLDQQAKAKRRS